MRCVIPFACLLGLSLFVRGQELPSKEVIDPVKRSTVFVQVQGGDWQGSGSGFVVKATKEALFVATNYHVLAGANGERRIAPTEANRIARAAKVNLIFDSGSKSERSAKADIVAIDPDVDLAILRVTGLADPPPPIGLASSAKLVETMSVYSFGFPFGKTLGVGEASPAVTVGKAAISSLRLGDDGELSMIQIDGNLNPGNSGGPIVDVKGQLIGIAVARIRDGQGIGFAIPAAELKRVLNGGLGRPNVAALPGIDGKVTVKIEVGVIDPDSTIRDVSAHYVVVAPKGIKPAPNDQLEKAAGAKRVALKIEAGVAVGEITLDKPAGTLFVQATPDGRDGKGLSAIRSIDLTASALLAAGKPPAGWKEYVSKGNEFSVWIPERARSQFSRDRDVTIDQIQFRVASLRVEMDGDLVYMTDFLTISRGLSNRLKRNELEESFRQWVESERRGKVVGDAEVQLGTIQGREFRIEAPGQTSRARLFVLGDGKVLVLQVVGSNADLKGEGATMFMNSCRLSPPIAARVVVPPPKPKGPPMRAVDLPRMPANSVPPRTTERVKLPPATERDRATTLARDLFKEEFALTDSTARADFARKLFQQAAETDDDPVSQFVLYRESAQLAAAADIELALQACDAIASRFEGPTAEVLEPVIAAIAAKATKPEMAIELATFLMKRIEEALASDEVDTAGRLHKIAEQSALLSKDIKLARQAEALASDIAFLKSIQEKLNTAKATLKSKPDDAEANLILGKHACFLKGDWKNGLPLLAKSSDETLKKIATKETETSEDDRHAAIVLGDSWHEQLASIKDYPKTQIQLHIHSLYSRAIPVLMGLTKSKVENRLDELDKALQGKFANAALWPLARAAVRDRSYEKTQLMGGAFGDPDYSEIPASGGILIGFNYTYRRFGNQDSIDGFQPIYLTPSGERLGVAHGEMTKGSMMTLKAKPNYAIGKMAIRGGGHWGGTNVIFMRIDGKGLKASDSYESGWIGHTDQPNSPFLGDGRPIIGIFGKDQRNNVGICSIGFYVVGEKPAN